MVIGVILAYILFKYKLPPNRISQFEKNAAKKVENISAAKNYKIFDIAVFQNLFKIILTSKCGILA